MSSDEPTNSLDSSSDINKDGASSIVGRTGGGITCCITLCFNNSKRTKDLKFYVIPKDPNLRKKW